MACSVAVAAVAIGGVAWSVSVASEDDGDGRGRGRHPSGRTLALGPCENPYVPAAPGHVWRYRFDAADRAGAATATWRVADVQRDGDGYRIGWSVHLHDRETGEDERRTLDRRCDPHAGAEDPWFGVSTAVELIGDARTWRFPASLGSGQRIQGAIATGAGELEVRVEREARVVRSETVTVPAGTYQALRVEARDAFRARREALCVGARCLDPAAAETRSESTLWLSAGVGLVRLRQTVEGETIDQVLVAIGSGDGRPGQ
jgi:hypothetical protein